MSIFAIASILVGLSAFFGYLNHRYLHLPHTIGLVAVSYTHLTLPTTPYV